MGKIIAYLQGWHITRSSAFHDLLVEPIRPYLEIEIRRWDGVSPLHKIQSGDQYIFCQLDPPSDWLQKAPQQIIWIPMWDSVRVWRQNQWSSLPKALRIVAFSSAVAKQAKRVNLPTLSLQYYKNPIQFKEANWDQRVLFYWNRTGLVNQEFLEQFCRVLKIDRLIFRPQIDPHVPETASYSLPKRIENTSVEVLKVLTDREAYFQKLQEANIFIAPRAYEGAGMSFLEAMASGSAVFANDAPTMNEYITQGEDGYLFPSLSQLTPRKFLRKIQRRLARFHLSPTPPPDDTTLPLQQDWDAIARLDLQKLGTIARERHKKGFEQWQNSIEEYAHFISG